MRQIPGVNGVPGPIPIIGRQGPSRDQQMQTGVMQAMHQLSTAIYTQLAISEIASVEAMLDLDRERLRKHAQDARTAAQAYFEGLGITFETKP